MNGWLAFFLTAIPLLDVATKDQRVVSGDLIELSAERVVIRASDAGKPQSVATAEVVAIRPHQPREAVAKPAGIQVRLMDGSVIEAAEYRVESGKAVVVLDPTTRLSVPTRVIDYVRLQTSAGALAQQWSEILKADRTGDTIVVRKEQTLDFVAGVAGDITDEHLYFEVDGDKVPVKRPKVEGLLYFHAAADHLPASFCSLQLVGGSKLEIASAKVADDRLEAITPTKVSVSVPWSNLLQIQFKTSYLSDLEPESVAYSREKLLGFRESLKPHDLAFHRPRLNEGFESGQPLRIGGQAFTKGIALYSGAEIAFRLTEGYHELQALVGIDDSARPHGRVELRILGEPATDKDGVLATHTISGRDPPLLITVPVDGVRRLRIVVRSLGGGDHDRLYLCEPRLVK